MCVESARRIRSANGRVPGTAFCQLYTRSRLRMGAQSYPGAVWAPVTRFPPNWQFTSQTLDCLLSHGFFFQPIASRRAPVPHRIPGLVSQPSTHPLPSGRIWKKRKSRVESKNRRFQKGRIFSKSRYRESGLGQRVVPRLFVRATRGREKATLWRLPDLAVNFQGLHTCARGRRGRPARGGRYCSERRIRTVE